VVSGAEGHRRQDLDVVSSRIATGAPRRSNAQASSDVERRKAPLPAFGPVFLIDVRDSDPRRGSTWEELLNLAEEPVQSVDELTLVDGRFEVGEQAQMIGGLFLDHPRRTAIDEPRRERVGCRRGNLRRNLEPAAHASSMPYTATGFEGVASSTEALIATKASD
jgi:hypothetical protein